MDEDGIVIGCGLVLMIVVVMLWKKEDVMWFFDGKWK